MIAELDEAYSTVTKELGFYFEDSIKIETVIGKGNVQERSIQTPFCLKDGSRLELRLRREGEDVILHDNSKIYQYLSAYGISISSKSLRQKRYKEFIDMLKERNGFGYDENWKWFFTLPLASGDETFLGTETWRFINSLQAMSYLSLTKTLRGHT